MQSGGRLLKQKSWHSRNVHRHRQYKTKTKPTPNQNSKKCLLSLVKEPGKGSLVRQKLFIDNNLSTPAKDHRKKYGPTTTHVSRGQVGNLNFHLMRLL